jgi:hypothetical protein
VPIASPGSATTAAAAAAAAAAANLYIHCKLQQTRPFVDLAYIASSKHMAVNCNIVNRLSIHVQRNASI